MVDHEGDEEFALEVLDVLGIGEECLEELVGVSEVVGGEAPEVHRNGGGVGDRNPLFVFVEVLNRAVVTFDLGAFYHRGEEVLFVDLAHTAAHGATLREGVAYAETYHGIAAGAAFGERREEFAHHLEGVAIVEVVAVEHGEGFFDHVLAPSSRRGSYPRAFDGLRGR